MRALGKTPASTLLIFITMLVTESSCPDKNQTMQNSSSPMPEVNTTVFVQMGTKALLCCPSIPLTKAILITWIITLRGQPSCIIAYKADTRETHENNCSDRSITWASTPDLAPDLQISAVALQHEGRYLCEIAVPEGHFQNIYDFQVLVPPEVTHFPGENRTAVCEAIAGKPAAQISWTPDGDCVTKTESHSNGTMTVRSTCHWEQSNVSVVFCVVSHLTTGNQSLSIELSRGGTSTPPSLLTIIYVKMALLGIILLIVGFAFFQKRNYTRHSRDTSTLLTGQSVLEPKLGFPDWWNMAGDYRASASLLIQGGPKDLEEVTSTLTEHSVMTVERWDIE